MDSGFGETLKRCRKSARLTIPQLAEALDVSLGTIGNWEAGRAFPDARALCRLCRVLRVSPNELLGYREEELPAECRSLVKGYRQLRPRDQRVVLGLIGSMKAEDRSLLRTMFTPLPRMATPAAAGTGCAFGDEEDAGSLYLRSEAAAGADAVIRVSGESMLPVYKPGDEVLVKYTQDVRVGDDVICSTGDGAVIKRVGPKGLYSVNSALPFGEHFEDDNVRVVGRVLRVVSPEEKANARQQALLEERD